MIAIEIPKVKYLSLSASRYVDEPYRYVNPKRTKYVHQCNGPIAAIAAGASALSAGFATTGFLGGLMMVGGVAGIIGGLTGNKTLMALGSIAGMAGGFVTPEGAFNNPFTSFGESSAAKGFSSVFDSIKETLGVGNSMPPSVDGYDIAGNVITNAGGNGAVLEAAKNTGMVIDEAGAIGGGGGGFLQQLGDTKGILRLAGGAAEAYQNQPLIDSKIEYIDANTSATQTQEDILRQRQQNMQFQNTGNMVGVNRNANPFQSAPGTADGRYAVVVDGQVKYITQAEYAQMQAAKNAGGGLINQGAQVNG